MATSTMSNLEDIENMVPNCTRLRGRKAVGVYKEKAAEKTKKDCRDRETRGAFLPLTNLAHPNDAKRVKLSENQNEPLKNVPKEIKQQIKKDKINSDILKVDKIHKKEKGVAAEKYLISTCLAVQEEYRQDIWDYLVQLEYSLGPIKSLYMVKQMHLTWKMRSVLVDWLASVVDEYNMSEQTFHLTVNYIDRFLSQISVVREKFQLVGTAAMMIAAKVEEIYPPETAEWAYLTADAYTTKQILKMEQLVLKVLRFRVQPPTMFTFIQHLCAEHQLDVKTKHLAMYISELVLLEGEDYLNQVPSKLAAASIALARLTLSDCNVWTKPLRKSTGYTLKELSPVVKKQQKTFEDSPHKESQAIQIKYKTAKYHKVALLKPRILNLDEVEDMA